ncbi:MAG TPA: thiamine phosphate synthase [Vicinamibacterales bacterium]|nr:thiamine phosphate synthase [Vicinamibacterales bacterium]
MISDRRRFGNHGEDALVLAVGAAARAGVDLVQVRERDLDGRALVRLVSRCVEAARGTRTRVLVNDRIDVALAAGAGGVHLRGDSVPASRVRAMTPPAFVIGRSVHSVDESRRATEDGGLDYLMFGTVFATSSKPGVEAAGVASLREVSAGTPLPVLAVGGITEATACDLQRTGAAGIAAIGLFADAALADMAATIARVARAFEGNG